MNRRLISVLAIASLAPMLSMSALAQMRSPDYRLNAAETALYEDVKLQCKSVLDPIIAQARAEGESQANIDNGLGQFIAPTIQGEMSSESNLRAILAQDEMKKNSVEARMVQCIVNARLTQIRNGNRPVSTAAASPSAPAAPARASAAAEACEDLGKQLQIDSRSWPETGNARALKLGMRQKALFTGECAGVPNAAAWVAGAERMIAGAGGSAGATAGAGSTAVLDHNGNVVRSSGGRSSGGASGGRAMSGASAGAPVPDANGCIDIVENTRGQNCGKPDSMAVRIKNHCTYKVHMQACIYDTSQSRWECGSGSGLQGGDVLTYRCQARGDFLYAGCSEASWRAASGGSCGGDPNKQGY